MKESEDKNRLSARTTVLSATTLSILSVALAINEYHLIVLVWGLAFSGADTFLLGLIKVIVTPVSVVLSLVAHALRQAVYHYLSIVLITCIVLLGTVMQITGTFSGFELAFIVDSTCLLALAGTHVFVLRVVTR